MNEAATITQPPGAAYAPDTDVLFEPHQFDRFNLRHRIVMEMLTRSPAEGLKPTKTLTIEARTMR